MHRKPVRWWRRVAVGFLIQSVFQQEKENEHFKRQEIQGWDLLWLLTSADHICIATHLLHSLRSTEGRIQVRLVPSTFVDKLSVMVCVSFSVFTESMGWFVLLKPSLKTPHTSFGLGRMFLESGTKFSCLFFSQKHPVSWGKVLLRFQRWVFKGGCSAELWQCGEFCGLKDSIFSAAFPVLVQPRPYWRRCLFQVLAQTNLSLDKGVVVIVLCCHPCLNCPLSYRHSSGTSQLA